MVGTAILQRATQEGLTYKAVSQQTLDEGEDGWVTQASKRSVFQAEGPASGKVVELMCPHSRADVFSMETQCGWPRTFKGEKGQ